MCSHQNVVQQKQVVNPPVNCYPFTVRFNVCNDCGANFTTTKQRRKNRANYSRASRKYQFNNQTHGIYY